MQSGLALAAGSLFAAAAWMAGLGLAPVVGGQPSSLDDGNATGEVRGPCAHWKPSLLLLCPSMH